MVSFAFFTLALSYLVRIFHLDPNILRLVAVVVIAFLGLSLIIPAFSTFLEVLISRLTGLFGNRNANQNSGFAGGFITGLTLGIVWSPCAGPILAAIAALSATGQVSIFVVLITISYVIGVGIPLFIFAYGGQQIVTRTRFVSSKLGYIQKVFGVIMILTALAIYTNYDKYLQTTLLNAFPALSGFTTSFETNKQVRDQLNILKGTNQSTPQIQNMLDTSGLFNTNSQAPDFVGVTKWLNLPEGAQTPSIQNLKGKVVLVDFWTYTCINCIRTLPHVTSWYDKYHDKGFVVIGVHTPEFQFEYDTANVQNAIKMYNIHYPVAQDNNYKTWNNYNNEYWPAEYLIDAAGNVRRTHFGEGEYDETEKAIQTLLKEAGATVSSKLDSMPDQTPHTQISPETYLNSKRMQYFYPTGNTGDTSQTFTLSKNIPQDTFSLGGDWVINSENATAGENAVLEYHFSASKVFLVLRPGNSASNSKVKVILDGKVVDSTNSGTDVKDGVVTVDLDRLYNVIDLHGNTENHVLRLELPNGVEAFAFTFG